MAGVKVTLTCAGCGKEHAYDIPTANAQEYRQAVLRLFYLGGMVEGHEWSGEFADGDQKPLAFLCRNSECHKQLTDRPQFDQTTRIFARPSEQFIHEGQPSLSSED